jgi:t-SNARE complex subunit (syntaxin)
MVKSFRKVRHKRMWIYIILAIVAAFCAVTAFQHHCDMKAAYERLNAYSFLPDSS